MKHYSLLLYCIPLLLLSALILTGLSNNNNNVINDNNKYVLYPLSIDYTQPTVKLMLHHNTFDKLIDFVYPIVIRSMRHIKVPDQHIDEV